MNATTARHHIINNISDRSVGVHTPKRTEWPEDDVVQWAAKIEDLNGSTGWAVFDEHYGEVDITWD